MTQLTQILILQALHAATCSKVTQNESPKSDVAASHLQNLQAGYLDVDWRDVEFPVGSLEFPRSRRGEAKAFLLCKVALGRASTVP